VSGVWCLVSGVCYLVSAICSLLSPLCSLLSALYSLLPALVVVERTLTKVYELLLALGFLISDGCYLLLSSVYLSSFVYCLLAVSAADALRSVPYFFLSTACCLSPAGRVPQSAIF
jgi:hypothetical protein